MISFLIKRSKKLFAVSQIGEDEKPLNISKRLRSYNSAIKNIKAVVTGVNAKEETVFEVKDLYNKYRFQVYVLDDDIILSDEQIKI